MEFKTQKSGGNKAKKQSFNLYARLYKYTINEKGWMEVVFYKGNRKNDPQLFNFVIYNRIIVSEMIRLIEKVNCKRFKIKFNVITKEWNGKFYTSLVIIECKEWLTIKEVVNGGVVIPEPKLSLNWNENKEF
jgi:hypothetical protein